ncbi:hypothetical protein GWK47_014959 [Chionoecetes opilio]|uniref:RNase H type-1 domain-containing protein n=1 Tax=Chionoecetes opilio TaxID=41210 RepID=A0A8J5C036_CHIOP|nr:hypothetical protein GWK47_014959 [Chionoecetes opilio]
MIYVTFIRSVIDYLSPALIQLPHTSLDPLDKFQNRVMRVILGCPLSTRVVNMLTELHLPPIYERICSIAARLTIKCLHYPQVVPHYSHTIRSAMQPRPRIPPLQAGGRTLIKTVSSLLQRLDINVPEAEALPGPPPWMIPTITVHYTPTSKSALPALQRQLALETKASISSSRPTLNHVYTDGSLQPDGTAGCAVFSPDVDPPPDGWVGRRLPVSASSTFCELYGILDAVSLLSQRGLNGLVICDSQSALQALSSPKPTCHLVSRILSFLSLVRLRALQIIFLWIPSHVGILYSDTVDGIAKAACSLPLRDAGPSPSLSCYLLRVNTHTYVSTLHHRARQRANSVSIQHYDAFRQHRYKYRRRGLMVRRHNVVAARLRLGYRPVWQVAGFEDAPHFSSCLLCDQPNSNSLEHYCLHCPEVSGLLPLGRPLVDICRHLLAHDNLDEILVRYPRFGGC